MRRRLFCFLGGTLVLLIGAISSGSSDVDVTQPDVATGWMEAFGSKWFQPGKDRANEPYTLMFVFTYRKENIETIPVGGMAAFGAFDSGDVMLLGHVEYTPNLAGAVYTHAVYPPGRWLEPSQTPRYVLMCALPVEYSDLLESVPHAYAERDSVKTGVMGNGREDYIFISLKWHPVPEEHAQSKFASQDYCGEIAETKQPPVPVWLPDTKYK